MTAVSASDILDITMAGTSATLLARRWESALLVNVDNETLQRLLNNEDAMNAIMNIEGFRSLNRDIETIINKSNAVKKIKSKGNEEMTPKKRKNFRKRKKNIRLREKKFKKNLLNLLLEYQFSCT